MNEQVLSTEPVPLITFYPVTTMWKGHKVLGSSSVWHPPLCMIFLNFILPPLPTVQYLNTFPALLLTPWVVYFDNVDIVERLRNLKSTLSLSSKLQGKLCVITDVEVLSDYKILHPCERLLLYFEEIRLKEGEKILSYKCSF